MKDIIELSKEFEKRNNISITVCIHSDYSGFICEFWDNEEITTFEDLNGLTEFLSNANLRKDRNGRSLTPVIIEP